MPRGITVIESEAYRRAAALYGRDRMMDNVKESFDFILHNDPYYGSRLPGTEHLYTFRTKRFSPRAPSFRILYKYDPEDDLNVVELLHIEPIIEDDLWG